VIDAACNARMRNGTFSLRVGKELGIPHLPRKLIDAPLHVPRSCRSCASQTHKKIVSTSRESRRRFAPDDRQARTPSSVQHFLLCHAAISDDDARRTYCPSRADPPPHRVAGWNKARRRSTGQ
jgi:hypothetical protein